MRIKKSFITLLILATLGMACSCFPIRSIPANGLLSDKVFYGKLIKKMCNLEIWKTEFCDENPYLIFQKTESFKGSVGSLDTLQVDMTCYKNGFVESEDYIIYSKSGKVGMCDNTSKLEYPTTKEIDVLRSIDFKKLDWSKESSEKVLYVIKQDTIRLKDITRKPSDFGSEVEVGNAFFLSELFFRLKSNFMNNWVPSESSKGLKTKFLNFCKSKSIHANGEELEQTFNQFALHLEMVETTNSKLLYEYARYGSATPLSAINNEFERFINTNVQFRDKLIKKTILDMLAIPSYIYQYEDTDRKPPTFASYCPK